MVNLFRLQTTIPPEAQVGNGKNEGALPPLIGDVITDPKHYIDNLFADIRKKLKFNARIKIVK